MYGKLDDLFSWEPNTEYHFETPFYEPIRLCIRNDEETKKWRTKRKKKKFLTELEYMARWGTHHWARIGEAETCAHHIIPFRNGKFEKNMDALAFVSPFATNCDYSRTTQKIRASMARNAQANGCPVKRNWSERIFFFHVHRTNGRHIAAKITKRNYIAFSPLGKNRGTQVYNKRRKRRLTTILIELFDFFFWVFDWTIFTHRLSTATSAILLYWFFFRFKNRQRFNDKLMNLNSIGFQMWLNCETHWIYSRMLHVNLICLKTDANWDRVVRFTFQHLVDLVFAARTRQLRSLWSETDKWLNRLRMRETKHVRRP